MRVIVIVEMNDRHFVGLSDDFMSPHKRVSKNKMAIGHIEKDEMVKSGKVY